MLAVGRAVEGLGIIQPGIPQPGGKQIRGENQCACVGAPTPAPCASSCA